MQISLNCQACGVEEMEQDLKTVKLAGFYSPLRLCKTCLKRSVYESFKDAAEIVQDISKIATASSNPEERLKKIKEILGIGNL
jgi:hypothetical protein